GRLRGLRGLRGWLGFSAAAATAGSPEALRPGPFLRRRERGCLLSVDVLLAGLLADLSARWLRVGEAAAASADALAGLAEPEGFSPPINFVKQFPITAITCRTKGGREYTR